MNKTYENMINKFLAEHKQPTAEDLYNFIIDNEWKIYHEYEKMCHKDDLFIELTEMGHNPYLISPDIIESILYTFEDRLSDSDDWHYILKNTIYDYEEDLKGEK